MPNLLKHLALAALLLLSAASAQTRGGTAVVGLIQEPGQLNRFVNSQSGSDLFWMVQEPMFIADADGNYQPLLASEVPAVSNGGVSDDYLTVTYRLRDGLQWSDGEPLTSEDVVFTWQAIQDPGSAATGSAIVPAYQKVESVRALDDLTVEVKMSEPNPGYLELWQAILPSHEFEGTAVEAEHPQARMPLGTGPFVLEEWRTGDRIKLTRNPNYREEGKPYLDSITVQIIPDRQVALSSLTSGAIDTLYFVATTDLPTLTDAQENGAEIVVELQQSPSWVEWLWLNHSDHGDHSKPHPVLGDPAIRESIDLAIDRQTVIDEVLGGFGTTTGSFIYAGFAAVERPAAPFDPEAAREVLEQAGWTDTDGDGIREKDGVRASLKHQTIAGDLVRELYQQVIQQNLADVGIEMTIENVPSNVLFGSYADGALMRTGNFDIAMSRDGYYVDPVVWAGLFTCDFIPDEENPNRFSYTHWCNPEFDRVVEEAATTPDIEARKAAYAQAVEIFAEERVALPLYSSAWGWAWNERLAGVSTDYWLGMWPSAADWYIEQ